MWPFGLGQNHASRYAGGSPIAFSRSISSRSVMRLPSVSQYPQPCRTFFRVMPGWLSSQYVIRVIGTPFRASFEMRGSPLRSGTLWRRELLWARDRRRLTMPDLKDARVLMIATDGFENDELFKPRQALIAAGAKVTLASIKTAPIQGEKGGEEADTITPALVLSDVDTEEFDALVNPGGESNTDKMRMQDRAEQIVEEFMDDDKIGAAICHGPWLLVEADVVDGRKMTSWPSVRTDLENAGADVVDDEVVVDGKLITSRKPDDIPAFNRAIIEALAEELAEALFGTPSSRKLEVNEPTL